ncbi:MAG TPA: hypothetical protein VF516_25320 [Kofleriaceae bacterium]
MSALVVAALGLAGRAHAIPPNAPANLRPGANHHTGDDAFVENQGRPPRPDEEKLRMLEHFRAVHARLAARKATRPELQATRDRLLAHLATYIARGTTPENTHLPWRTPVFIDDQGVICAVGYLIEQSAGRALAERIAAEHRYDYIEDIARDMAEVRAWVESSGFTLDELGQIQPGYPGPDVLLWHDRQFVDDGDDMPRDDTGIPDGPYQRDGMRGAFVNHRMEGMWELRGPRELDPDADLPRGTRAELASDVVLGHGEFHRGRGHWVSFYPSGARLAVGDYVDDAPSGRWRFYHESGALAAEGRFVSGQRTGPWRFYYDEQRPTPIAIGRFSSDGHVEGRWRHFDANGELLATSRTETPASWRHKGQLFWSVGYLVDVVPTSDGIVHQIHQGAIDGEELRLERIATPDRREQLYAREHRGDAWTASIGGDPDALDVFDRTGAQLVNDGESWRADPCGWSAARRRAARAGDVVTLHGLLDQGSSYQSPSDEPECTRGPLLDPARAARISALVTKLTEVRAASPGFLKRLVLDSSRGDDPDLTRVIASTMALDIEWPHVDRRFIQVYQTLPGYRHI